MHAASIALFQRVERTAKAAQAQHEDEQARPPRRPLRSARPARVSRACVRHDSAARFADAHRPHARCVGQRESFERSIGVDHADADAGRLATMSMRPSRGCVADRVRRGSVGRAPRRRCAHSRAARVPGSETMRCRRRGRVHAIDDHRRGLGESLRIDVVRLPVRQRPGAAAAGMPQMWSELAALFRSAMLPSATGCSRPPLRRCP